MNFELDDELWPARRSLVGLQFADQHDFARAQELIGNDLDFYREVYPYWSMIVVRRTDVPRFTEAGFRFTEIDQIDDEELMPEEVARRDRELIDSWKPILFSRARQSGWIYG
jgi:hypothetical protein